MLPLDCLFVSVEGGITDGRSLCDQKIGVRSCLPKFMHYEAKNNRETGFGEE